MNINKYGRQIYDLLHQIAEISSREEKTRHVISELVSAIGGYEVLYDGKKGLVFCNSFPDDFNFDIGFRAEIDALKMPDGNVFHGCGHDLHMAALIQSMAYFKNNNSSSRILFIFQSSEEVGNGAREITDLIASKKIHIKRMYGIHNAPEIPVNALAVKSGKILANNVTCRYSVTFSEDRRYSEKGKDLLSVWDSLYAKLVELNLKEPEINYKIGEFMSNGQVGVQANRLNFTLSLRSTKLCANNLKKKMESITDDFRITRNVEKVSVEQLAYHWQVNNDEMLCQELKANDLFLVLETPEGYTSDDFCYYEKISSRCCYLFLGSYKNIQSSMTHTTAFEPNLKFMEYSLELYRYITEMCK